MEMPDQQSGHESDDSKKDHHADHSARPPRTLFLLQLFGVRDLQEVLRLKLFTLENNKIDCHQAFVKTGNNYYISEEFWPTLY